MMEDKVTLADFRPNLRTPEGITSSMFVGLFALVAANGVLSFSDKASAADVAQSTAAVTPTATPTNTQTSEPNIDHLEDGQYVYCRVGAYKAIPDGGKYTVSDSALELVDALKEEFGKSNVLGQHDRDKGNIIVSARQHYDTTTYHGCERVKTDTGAQAERYDINMYYAFEF